MTTTDPIQETLMMLNRQTLPGRPGQLPVLCPQNWEIWADGVFQKNFFPGSRGRDEEEGESEARDAARAEEPAVFKYVPSLRRADLVPITGRPVWIVGTGRSSETLRLQVAVRFPRALKSDPTKTEYMTLWVDREAILNRSSLIQLAGRTVPVNSENAGQLVKFFQACLDENEHRFELIQVLARPAFYVVNEKFGWVYGKKWYGDPGARVEVDAEAELDFDGALRKSGTPETWEAHEARWHEFVDPIWESHHVVRWMMSATFASLLLGPLNERNFVIHHYFDSKAGKSAIHILCQTIWGKGRMLTSSFVHSMKSNMDLFRWISDYPLYYNDTQSAQEKNTFDQLVYFWGEGLTRKRLNQSGTTATRSLEFRGILRTTGEEPMKGRVDLGGQKTRTLNFPADGVSEADAQSIYHFLQEDCFGHAGARFLGRLSRDVNDPGIIEALGERRQELAEAILQLLVEDDIDTQGVGDWMSFLSIIALGEYLSAHWIFDYTKSVARSLAVRDAVWAYQQLQSRPESQRALWERALDDIRDHRNSKPDQWGQIYSAKFVGPADGRICSPNLSREQRVFQPLMGIETENEIWLIGGEVEAFFQRRYGLNDLGVIWSKWRQKDILKITNPPHFKSHRQKKGVLGEKFSANVYVLDKQKFMVADEGSGDEGRGDEGRDPQI